MGGGTPSGSTSSSSQATIAPELQPLYSQTGTNVMAQQTENPLSQFNISSPMGVAEMTNLQNYGASLVPQLAQTPGAENLATGYAMYAPYAAGRTATGEGIATNPAITAQLENYRQNVLPGVQNQMALAGLGRSSSLGNAMALGEASMLPALYESQLAREQGALTSQAEMYGQMVPQLTALGAQETGRLGQAITAAETVGGTQQATEQAKLQAEYQDMLRRQALAEEALYTPFNQLVSTGAIGQLSSGTSSQSGGGMFK